MRRKPILCLDFDGVCHAYTSGWQGATRIPDGAVPGLFEFLGEAAPHFDIQVFSSRSNLPGGIEAMQSWFAAHQQAWLEEKGRESIDFELKFPTQKPPATVSLDDRALTFNGNWPQIAQLKSFQPWYRAKSETAVSVVMRYLDAFFGERIDVGRIRPLLTDNFTFTGPLMTATSADDYIQKLKQFGKDASMQAEIYDVFENGSVVVARYDFVMLSSKVPASEWYRITNNQISDMQLICDPRSFLG